jgi:putative DNA primase/helicase
MRIVPILSGGGLCDLQAKPTRVAPTGPANNTGRTKKPNLIVDGGDLPATAYRLRDLLRGGNCLFDRGVPVRVVPGNETDPPTAISLTVDRVVVEAHRLCRPVKVDRDELVPITLPDRVARMYFRMEGEWDLPPLAGICTAPLLSADGTARSAMGYDPVTRLWCANLATLQLAERPTRAEAEAALRLLRETFRTFPFADAERKIEPMLGIEVNNINVAPGMDESAFLVGLLTAICRTSLWLAPALLVRGPEISGAGTGKGLLVRSICAIAFGIQPSAFTKGADRQELDKRLASDLIQAAPILFLDNVNSTTLRSDILASVLTERPARVRALGRTEMVTLNSTAFIAVTGNGVGLTEDLARRFLVCELNAHCEDPEQRLFEVGFLGRIEHRRYELLSAALTIWRWGRQAAPELVSGRPLGSFEDWASWCRDPLLALGCRDPVERVEMIKADDPQRRQIVELFETWAVHHAERPTKVADLAEPVRRVLDPQGRGRQFTAARLTQLTDTCIGGFVLTRQPAAGKWGRASYALRRVDSPVAKP